MWEAIMISVDYTFTLYVATLVAKHLGARLLESHTGSADVTS